MVAAIEGLERDQRRMRLTVIGVALAITVPIAALVPFLGLPILFVLPVVMGYLGLSNATEWLVAVGKWPIL